MGAIVRDNHMTFGGIHYFRGNATAVGLGAYGRKKSPLFGVNFLEIDGHLGMTMALPPAVVVDLDTTSSNRGEASAGVNVVTVAGGSVGGTWDNFASHKLKLVQFCLELGQVKALVKASSGADDCLKDNKNTGRVAYQVWVVMEAEEASRFSGGAALSAHATIEGVQITATAANASSDTSRVVISRNSTYAYLLARPMWKGNTITSFTTDQWSFS